MVCIGIRTSATLKLGKLNPDIALEALKLMFPGAKYGFDNFFGTKAQAYIELENGNRAILRFRSAGVTVQSNDVALGKMVEQALTQHYAAIVQAALLKKQGYQVQVQKDKDRLRIVGRG